MGLKIFAQKKHPNFHWGGLNNKPFFLGAVILQFKGGDPCFFFYDRKVLINAPTKGIFVLLTFDLFQRFKTTETKPRSKIFWNFRKI